MKKALEFAPFLLLAVAGHVWAMTHLPDGSLASGGDQGEAAVSLIGADPVVSALVADWMRPPETSASAPDLPQAIAQTAAPFVAQLDIPTLPTSAALPPAASIPQAAPQIIAKAPKPQAAPKKPRAQPSAPPKQRAAGSGKAHIAGTGTAQDNAKGAASSASLGKQWGGAIRSAIARAQRPTSDRARGTVHLRISVQVDGRLASVSMHKSSGHAGLDAAAVDAVRRAKLPAAPKGLKGTQHFNLPIAFKG